MRRSTEEIVRHIAQVRAATGASVEAVARIERTITEVDGIAGSIAAAVEQQGAATSEIARSMSHTAASAQELDTGMATLVNEAEMTGEQSRRLGAEAHAISTALDTLRETVVNAVRRSAESVDGNGRRAA